jgi:hypothetical protein
MRCTFLKETFSLFGKITATGGKLLLRQPDQNRILTDTFNVTPRNDQLLLLFMAKKTVISGNDQSQNSGILPIKFKIAGISQADSVTQIDNFQFA